MTICIYAMKWHEVMRTCQKKKVKRATMQTRPLRSTIVRMYNNNIIYAIEIEQLTQTTAKMPINK
jgi:hypothetical protein